MTRRRSALAERRQRDRPVPQHVTGAAASDEHPAVRRAQAAADLLGCGYLGSTYAACFAELGYEVLGLDIDEAKIAKLSAGDNPIHEPGLDELLKHKEAELLEV